MSPQLATELKIEFSAEPRWDGFKLTCVMKTVFPLTNEGSGVRRLILLNFFRAEAERRAVEAQRQHTIFAIEEPEASQHPHTKLCYSIQCFNCRHYPISK